MTFGSLFSGVGGFDLGLERAGMKCLWQVEYDEQAQSVLRRHWPDVDLYKDVCDVGSDELAAADLICGGFPCQDLSVAGKREGLAGERSGLWWEFHRILGELAPRWVLIENVPGLLSSNEGRDMAVVLRGLEELGYGWTYRVLDSQFFGVPQRRRRVFIVGCSGGRPRPEILFEPESVPWHPAPSRETWQESAGTAENCSREQGRIAHTLTSANPNAPKRNGKRQDGSRTDRIPMVAHPITAREHKGPNSDCDSGNLVPQGFHYTSVHHTGSVKDDLSQTLKGGSSIGLEGTAAIAYPPQSLAIRGRGGVPQAEPGDDEQANALLTPNGGRGGIGVGAVMHTVPRRLTPRECERLQGFPDDWTRWDDEGNELADSPRYRMMGNAVTVNVGEWIGRRLMEAA